jgi:hypothetical protein
MIARLALPLTAALACLAFVAPSAVAFSMTDYRVTIEGSATYQRTDIGPGALGNWVQNQKAEFSWKSEFPTVTFIDKTVATAGGATINASVKSASMDVSIPTPEGPLTGACSGTTWQLPPTPGVISGDVQKPEGAEYEGIWLRVLSGGDIRLDSCSGALGGGPYGMSVDGGAPDRLAPYVEFFQMPHEAIGMGKIIQLLNKTVTGVPCPGYYGMTDSCNLTWKATVTFVRTSHIGLDEPVIGPAPPQPSEPHDPPQPVEPAGPSAPERPTTPSKHVPGVDLEDLFIPLPDEATLSRSGASATVPVLCAGGCRGTAVATALRGGRAHGAAAKPLARATFVAAAGRKTLVRLRFRPAARRAIRKAGGIKVALTATPNGGAPQRTTLTIRRAR